jgi:hypothetical protein
VTLREVALGEHLEDLVGEVEQPDQVRDRRAGAAQAAGQVLLREPQLLDQRRARSRLVDRVEVLARHVFDQRRLHPRRLVLVAQERRDLGQPGLPGRAPATLARDQLIAAVGEGPHDHRLDHAGLGNRLCQGRDRVRVDATARLLRVGPDQLDGDLAIVGLARFDLGQDRRQAASHPPAGAHAATALVDGSRVSSSCARSR